MAKKVKKHGVKLPPQLVRQRRKVKDMKTGEVGFISSGSIVAVPSTLKTFVWAEADVAPSLDVTSGLVFLRRTKDGVALAIPSKTKVDPREKDPEQRYIPVEEIRIATSEEVLGWITSSE